MKSTQTYIIVLAAIFIAGFIACKSSSNAVGSVSVPSFSFAVHSSFLLQQWPIDQSGNKIVDSMHYVHETIVDSNVSIGGESNVYFGIDSTFDSTNTNYLFSDSIYFREYGSQVFEYDLMKNIVNTYAPGSVSGLPEKWNMLMEAGNAAGWLVDTSDFNATILGNPATLRDSLYGQDVKDTTMFISGDTLLVDNAQQTGTIALTSSIYAPVVIYTYMAYNPAVVVKLVSEPTTLKGAGYNFNGIERDLISVVTK